MLEYASIFMANNFFLQHLDLIFFFYGLSFLTLAAFIFSQIRTSRKSKYRIFDILWLLALFGATHGFNEFLDMFALMKHDSLFLDISRPLFLIASYLFLYYFGFNLINLIKNKTIGLLLLLINAAAFLCLPILFGLYNYQIWTISARYFLGFPGALLTAIGLIIYFREEAGKHEFLSIRNHFISASLTIGIYGILGGIIVPKAFFFPASVINTGTFIALTGIPVQLFRAVCAIVFTWNIWNIANLFNLEEESARKSYEEELKRNSETQTATNSLLRLSLKDIPLKSLLEQALDLILSIPWLSLESRGAIFLAENDTKTLTMQAQRRLSPFIQRSCERIPFGKCLCGKAALTGQVQHASCVNDEHDITYDGIIPHGHYCVPILFGDNILGVINLYIPEGRKRKENEVEFLSAVANALAIVIQRHRAEDRIKDLLEETKTANDQLKKMDKTKDEFLSIITHDLKNPLVSVLSYSDMIMDGLAGPVTEKQTNYLATIKKQGSFLAEMIDSILDYTRTEFGKITLNRERFDLSALILDILNAIKPLADHKNLSLIAHLPTETVLVNYDQKMINRVIQNLTGNAVKYGPVGGRITVSLSQKDDRIRIMVEDNGIGIEKEHLPKIFDKFYLIDAAGAREKKSLGLGLYIAKSFIEAHNGNIRVESEGLGKGSKFIIDLPAS